MRNLLHKYVFIIVLCILYDIFCINKLAYIMWEVNDT